jgi:hypothetical protein
LEIQKCSTTTFRHFRLPVQKRIPHLFDNLLVSSPNGGGLLFIHGDQAFHLDTLHTTGISLSGANRPLAGGADFEAWMKLWRLWHLLFWGELPAEFAQNDRTKSRFLSVRTLDSSFEQQQKSMVG